MVLEMKCDECNSENIIFVGNPCGSYCFYCKDCSNYFYPYTIRLK